MTEPAPAAPRGLFFQSSRFWTAATALWTACVLGLAVSPQAESSWVAEMFGDKVLHGFAFAVGTICWAMAIQSPRTSPFRSLYGAVATLLVGLLIELLQGFVPGREQETGDLVADIAGIAFALLVLFSILSRKAKTQV